MITLNSQMIIRNDRLSEETRRLIDEAIAKGMINVIQPAGVDGSEVSRATRDNITAARAAFRKNAREKAKAAKAKQ